MASDSKPTDGEERELDIAREREAMREILKVISQSRDDEGPVFEALLSSARKLCEAPFGLILLGRPGDSHLRVAAHKGGRAKWIKELTENPPPRDGGAVTNAASIIKRRTIHIHDLKDTQLYEQGQPLRRMAVDEEGFRTVLFVPLVSHGEGIGSLCLYRREVKPFDDQQIVLVETFAAQAVIAIENVRQFRELQTRLEREEATRDILSVISESRDDDQRVFDVIVQHASCLCDARPVVLNMLNETRTHVRFVAKSDSMKSDSFVLGQEFDVREGRIRKQVIDQGEVLHVPDMAATQGYAEGDEWHRATVDREGVRTMLSVPLISGGRAIGFLMLIRREVRPFADDEIALIQTFAAQAVIAIENVRQFRELQTRLEREKATSGILSVISQSPDDDNPVFEAIHEHVSRLCDAPFSGLFLTDRDGEHMKLVSLVSANPDYLRETGTRWPLSDRTAMGRSIITKDAVHIADMRDTPGYRAGDAETVRAADQEGIGTFLAVPLMQRDRAIGCIGIYRVEVRPFSEDEISLIQTFAAQAVIAIENVRQFRELQTRLEREEVTREILQVISRSRDHEKPVFDMILQNAARLCGAPLASLNLLDEAGERLILQARWGEKLEEMDEGTTEFPLQGNSVPATTVRESRLVHIEDMADTEAYRSGDPLRVRAVDMHGIRSFLAVPLLRDGKAIGCIDLFRREVNPFQDRHVQLIETFAAQAVIAIENVRQFRAVLEARDDAESALADLKKAQDRLIQAEKMASLGQLTAGIAHEIKNPLNFVNNFAKLSGEMVTELTEILEGPIASLDEEEREDAEDLLQTVRDNLGKINEHGRRADQIVKNMLLHSREGPSQRGTAKVNSIANEALNLAYHGARAENPSFNVEMKTDLAEDVGVIECYPQDLMRVFLNIISNGMYAAHKRSLEEEGFAPTITVSSRRNGDRVMVEVRDNGQGIPAGVRDRIFTPFFTTKPAGEGTGLGLSLSYDIVVKQHGGDLTVDSEPGQFTAFTVSLPQSLPAENGGAG